MATTPNQKPVPSEDYANMRFNAGKFDEFMTSTASSYVDRLGVTHPTIVGVKDEVASAAAASAQSAAESADEAAMSAAQAQGAASSVDTSLNLNAQGLANGGDMYSFLTTAIATVNAYVIANGAYSTPVISINSGSYTLNTAIVMPSWIKIVAYGSVTINASSITTGSIISISNTVSGVDTAYQTGDTISSIGGTIHLIGPAQSSSSPNGIFIGNTSSGGSACRNVSIKNLAIKNTNVAVSIGSYNTYLLSFDSCCFGYNYINLASSSSTNQNSGERMSFNNCTFGHMISSHVYTNTPAMDLSFHNCSFDFGAGDVFLLGSSATVASIKVSQAHFEQWGGYLVNSPTISLTNTYVVMNQIIILARPDLSVSGTVANSPSRAIVNGQTSVSLSGIDFRHELPPYSEDPFATTGTRLFISDYVKDSFRCVPSTAYILNRGYDLSAETVGTDLATGTFSRLTVSSRSGMTGSVTTRSDGLGNQLTVLSASGTSYLRLAAERIYCQPGNSFYIYGAIQALSATGDLQMDSSMGWYDYAGVLISTSTSTVSRLMATSYADTSLPNYSLGTNRYMAAGSNVLTAPQGAAYCIPMVTFSKFTGTFNISRIVCAKVL